MAARCGERRRPGALLLGVLVGRFARREPALARLVAGFEDGELPVAATVRDLLDAGFVAEGAEALGELLAGHPDAAERARAEALVRVASGVALALDAGGLDLARDLLRRAARLLAGDPDRALPARAVLVHGFADATGVATDLVEALVRHRGASVYLDEPPDPADADAPDLGVAFGRRFADRLQGAAPVERAARTAVGAAAPRRLRRARGGRGGARGGAPDPRRCSTPARRRSGSGWWRATSRRTRGRSTGTSAAWGSRSRRSTRRGRATPRRAAPAPSPSCCGDGGAAPADSWLAAAGEGAAYDLRLALHACGAARVRDVAALDADVGARRERRAAAAGAARPRRARRRGRHGDGGRRSRSPRAAASPGARLRRAVDARRGARGAARGWPEEATLGGHLRRLARLLDEDLGPRWRARRGAEAGVGAATLAAELPDGLSLAREEFFMLVRRALDGVGVRRRSAARAAASRCSR